MTRSSPTVSVIIPAFNSRETISACLLSLAEQTLTPLEIFVVDDGSTDDTRTRAESCATVVSNTRAKGAGGARNTGAALARGDILAFTDSDCVLPPDWLQKIVAAFAADDGIGAVAGGYARHAGTGFLGFFACKELEHRRAGFPEFVQTAVSNNFAVRRSLFEAAGGFPEQFSGATLEDLIFSWRISRVAKIRWLHENGIGHHFHEQLTRYGRQQYAFARDTVLTYHAHPELLGVKTHQGKQLPAEVGMLGAAFLLRRSPRLALALVCGILLLNRALLADLRQTAGVRGAVWGSALLLWRNACAGVGVLHGLFLVGRRFCRAIRGRITASRFLRP